MMRWNLQKANNIQSSKISKVNKWYQLFRAGLMQVKSNWSIVVYFMYTDIVWLDVNYISRVLYKINFKLYKKPWPIPVANEIPCNRDEIMSIDLIPWNISSLNTEIICSATDVALFVFFAFQDFYFKKIINRLYNITKLYLSVYSDTISSHFQMWIVITLQILKNTQG